MSANTGLVTREMKQDFEAAMLALLPGNIEPFKQDLRDVLREYGQDYAAQWIKGWRQELETNGPTGPTGLAIELMRKAAA
jgi:hypothetical protein